MESIWAFLSDPDNQRTLGWLGGGLMVVAGGLWTLIQFVLGHSQAAQTSTPKSGVSRRRAVLAPSADFSGIQVGLLTAAVAGAVILSAAFAGTRITATNGVVNPGTIEDSTIIIEGGG